MASKLAQMAAETVHKVDASKARHFYLEICRCLPFVQRLHKLEEMVSVRELRAIVKQKFNAYRDIKDDRVVDILIFKGREEIETYLLMHKQRHHAITEILEPFRLSHKSLAAKPTGNSSFLDGFLSSPFPQLPPTGTKL